MTHELIANMLGVRREGVTEAGRSSPVRQEREANDATRTHGHVELRIHGDPFNSSAAAAQSHLASLMGGAANRTVEFD